MNSRWDGTMLNYIYESWWIVIILRLVRLTVQCLISTYMFSVFRENPKSVICIMYICFLLRISL